MASYQVPQFLDSGDKLFLGLNFRQFGYVLAGAGICIFIYFTLQALFPALGPYAIIFCIPVALLTIYLAWGKFNGRDSEVYVLKIILYLLKPRVLKYIRQPDYTEINKKMAENTYDKIIARWTKNQITSAEEEKNSWQNFDLLSEKEKLIRISQLAGRVDQMQSVAMRNIEQKNLLLENLNQSLESLSKGKSVDSVNAANLSGYTGNSHSPYSPSVTIGPNQVLNTKPKGLVAPNFFREEKEKVYEEN